MRHLTSRIASVLALTTLLLAPGTVMAHAELDAPTPADGATVEGTPDLIEGTFTQDLDSEGSSLVLRDSAGDVVAEGRPVDGEPRLMALDPVPDLPPGDYEVFWTTFSAGDGEGPIRGSWSFTVTATPTPEPTPEPTPTTAATDAPTPEPTVIEPTVAATIAATPSPSGDPAVSDGDVLLPIVAALAIVAIAGVVLLNRRDRATGA